MSFNWLVMFQKWAILSAWVFYLTQLHVSSDALWIRCTVRIEYSPIWIIWNLGLLFIYDILLGPHFEPHIQWAGTFLRDFVLHIIYVIYSTTHLCHLICDLNLCHLLYDLMSLYLFYKRLNWAWQLKYSRMLLRRWLWWFSCWLICACDICCCLHAPDLYLTYPSYDCVFIYECSSQVEQWYFDAIYGRWHGSCLYCSWFIYRGTCWHSVMIFNVFIHLSWCVISLTIWISYWINGINSLSCPHGQGSSQKRGLTF